MTTPSGDPRAFEPIPTALAAALTLRVAEARVEDIGHAIARLAPADLVRIGARPGDVLKITGSGITAKNWSHVSGLRTSEAKTLPFHTTVPESFARDDSSPSGNTISMG